MGGGMGGGWGGAVASGFNYVEPSELSVSQAKVRFSPQERHQIKYMLTSVLGYVGSFILTPEYAPVLAPLSVATTYYFASKLAKLTDEKFTCVSYLLKPFSQRGNGWSPNLAQMHALVFNQKSVNKLPAASGPA